MAARTRWRASTRCRRRPRPRPRSKHLSWDNAGRRGDAKNAGNRIRGVLPADQALLLIGNLTGRFIGIQGDGSTKKDHSESEEDDRQGNPNSDRTGMMEEIPAERAGDGKNNADSDARCATFFERSE